VSEPDLSPIADRVAGTLLGTALGDALGLPAEGMSARSIARRFGPIDRFRLLGRTGFVSDDTEQAALVAQSLIRHPDDVDRCVRSFRRSLLGWFCRLPWGVGLATVKASVKIGLGFRISGVNSAGNGSAMRAAIVGVFFAVRPADRAIFGRRLAEVTHRDPRAIEGALYVAELAAFCCLASPDADRFELQARARIIVADPQLGQAIDRGVELARSSASIENAARDCGTSGFVVQTLAFATFVFLKHGDEPLQALTRSIAEGGDTDSIAAILGAWLGALHGESRLPLELIARIHDGPFGPTHLRALARGLVLARAGEKPRVPGYSLTAALARNLSLYPVVLAHGIRRLLPF
jgi:ADP-ribosylglycohydrolase